MAARSFRTSGLFNVVVLLIDALANYWGECQKNKDYGSKQQHGQDRQRAILRDKN
jgi:uncharacterized protein YqgC (DUF456 family)